MTPISASRFQALGVIQKASGIAQQQRDEFLAERGLGLRRGDQPAPGIHGGAPHAKHEQLPLDETGAARANAHGRAR